MLHPSDPTVHTSDRVIHARTLTQEIVDHHYSKVMERVRVAPTQMFLPKAHPDQIH
jgi:hypothetical protein